MNRPLLAGALSRVLVSCTLVGGVLVAVSAYGTPALVQAPAPADAPTGAEARAARDAARVDALLREHGCWSDAAPAGAPAPRLAVVTLPHEHPRVVAADVGYGIWLDGEPGTLHGFCP